MDFSKNIEFLKSFYNCIGTPLYFYSNNNLEFILPEKRSLTYLLDDVEYNLFQLDGEANYLIDSNNMFWAIIYLPKSNDCTIIGPISAVPITNQISIETTKKVPNSKNRNELRTFLRQLPSYSIERSFNFIKHIYLFYYNKQLQLDQLFKVSNEIKEMPIEELHSSTTYTNRETFQSHETYNYEKTYLQYLKHGDIEGLTNMFKQVPDITVGTVGNTSLRQGKNIFIAAVTTTTRAAIEGGLSSIEAYSLSDVYIYNMEKMTNANQIYQFQYKMIMDFANRVAQRKLPDGTSSIIFKCAQYIASHVNEPITVQSVADYMGYSRPYLSKKFINELGFSMSSFITRCKLEEAKYLLINSDKTVGEISNYLCFSSQSYFQNVFRDALGVTPNKFREEI